MVRMPRPFSANAWAPLAHELHAGGFAATPDHLALVTGARIARKRKPQGGGQRGGLVEADLGTGARNILHHAMARGEATIERDPRRLAEQFTRFPFSGCRHEPLSLPPFSPYARGL